MKLLRCQMSVRNPRIIFVAILEKNTKKEDTQKRKLLSAFCLYLEHSMFNIISNPAVSMCRPSTLFTLLHKINRRSPYLYVHLLQNFIHS